MVLFTETKCFLLTHALQINCILLVWTREIFYFAVSEDYNTNKTMILTALIVVTALLILNITNFFIFSSPSEPNWNSKILQVSISISKLRFYDRNIFHNLACNEGVLALVCGAVMFDFGKSG